jgi:hypothetical protein
MLAGRRYQRETKMPLRTATLTRILIVAPALGLAVCLAAASANFSSSHACAVSGSPSKFDYLVLASLADSPQLPAMASYHPAARQHD